MTSESVWDHPRLPRVAACALRIRVAFGGETAADSTRAYRLLETSHSPSFCVKMELLKGEAQYWDLHAGGRTSLAAAWSYEAPSPAPARVDACFVGEERVRPEEGDFYGGWNTSNLIGPFKGGPGTRGW